jgi:hypothetical protein
VEKGSAQPSSPTRKVNDRRDRLINDGKFGEFGKTVLIA